MGNTQSPFSHADVRKSQQGKQASSGDLLDRLTEPLPLQSGRAPATPEWYPKSQQLPRKGLDLTRKEHRRLSISDSGVLNSPYMPSTPTSVCGGGPLALSDTQITIIRKHWSHVDRLTSENNIGVRIYLRVFELCPEVRKAFAFGEGWAESLTNNHILYSQKFQHQAQKFIAFLNRCVKDLDKPEDLRGYLLNLGQAHASYIKNIKIRRKHWDAFTDAMLECLVLEVQRSGGRRHSRLIGDAWRQLILWIIDAVREGYDEATRPSRAPTPNSEIVEPNSSTAGGSANTNGMNSLEEPVSLGPRRYSLPVPEHGFMAKLPATPDSVQGSLTPRGMSRKYNYSLRYKSNAPQAHAKLGLTNSRSTAPSTPAPWH